MAYILLSVFSAICFVAFLITGIQELNVVANITLVLGIMTFITHMANKEQQTSKIVNCPPHKWAYSANDEMFCQICGRRPNAGTD